MSEPARSEAPSSIEDRRAEHKPKAHRWSRWQREVRKRYTLSSKAIALLGELVDRADNETGECWGFQDGLVRALSLSERTIRRATRELQQHRLIAYRPGHQRLGQTRPEPCRFRLLPLEEGRPERPQVAATVTATPGGHTDRNGRPPWPQEADRVAALTVSRTTSSTEPPRPPAGGRGRDRDRWLGEMRVWTAAHSLPLDELGFAYVCDAVLRGLREPAAVAAFLEQTAWGRHRAELGNDPGNEQLTLGGNEWS